MPPSDYIRKLQKAIREQHGCSSRHFSTIPVTEKLRGKIAWQGDVEVFDLTGHPKAGTCYAWSYSEGGKIHVTTVLGIAPVDSAETAVKVTLAAEAKAQRKKS